MHRFKVAVCILGLFIGTVFICPQAEARSLFKTPHDLEGACGDLADDLADSGKLKNKRVAVLEFEPRGKTHSSMLDRRIAEYLSMALAGIGDRSWTVVERLELARMENEIQEHKDTSFDYNNWMRHHLNADLTVIGSYLFTENKLRITAKVVDSINGDTVASATVDQYVDDEVRQMSRTVKPATDFARIAENLQASLTGKSVRRQSKGSSRASLFRIVGGNKIPFKKKNPPVFSIGDRMGFSIKPPMDSKLYIFNYDPAAEQEEAILLYPIPEMEAAVFPGERTRIFPACISQGVDSYDVAEPRGRMIFKIIGIDSGVDMDLTRSLKLRDGYYWLDSSNLKVVIGDLSALPESSWWSEDIEFWIQ